MDVWNRVSTQFSDLYRSLSPGARLIGAATIVAVVAGLGYLVNLRTTDELTYLLGGHSFSTNELHAVQGAFGKAGLKDFEVEEGKIKIPRDQRDAYLGAIADAEMLPTNFDNYLLDVIREQSPWRSSRLHDQAIMAARERVLGNAISKMENVASAQVFISTLDKLNFRSERVITASVDVKMQGERRLDSRQVRAIRSLVAGGAAGLKREQITVIDSNIGRDFPGLDSNDPEAAAEEACLARQEALERRYEETILRLLADIPHATVSVRVELAPADEPRLSPAPSGDAIKPAAMTVNTSGAANARAVLGTVPGKLQPIEPAPISAASPAPTAVNRLVPARVTAAVTIPGGYVEAIWRKNQSLANRAASVASEQDLAAVRDDVCRKIQRLALTVIPHLPTDSADNLITVACFDEITSNPATATPSAATPDDWISNEIRAGGLVALGIASLAVFWNRLRSKRAIPATPPDWDDSKLRLDEGHSPLAGPHASRRAGDPAALRNDLAKTVRNDPAGAAQILREWISSSH